MVISSLKTLQGETVVKHVDGYLDKTNNEWGLGDSEVPKTKAVSV